MKYGRKTKKLLRSSVALVLSFSLLMTATGCQDVPSQSGDGETAEAERVPTDFVQWNKTGEYTAEIDTNGADLSDVAAANVKVLSCCFKNESDGVEADTAECPVSDAKYADGSLTVTFKDDKAADKTTDLFALSVNENELTATVYLNYPCLTARTDVSGISAEESSHELTVTLDDGAFSKSITTDDISLSGSFSEMTAKSVSANGGSLVLTLDGKAVIPDGQEVYPDGIVTVNASAIEGGHSPASLRIPVRDSFLMFESENMTVDKNTVTVPLTVMGIENTDGLSAEDISFADVISEDEEGENSESSPQVKVTGVEKQSDTQFILTMEVEGVTDRNSAARALDGRTIDVNGTSVTAGFSSAGFYPLFDYIEAKGDDFEITLELDAKSGTFAEDIGADDVTFDGELSDAKDMTLQRKDDITAALTFSIPSNGQTVESFNYDGTIELAPGALINNWGDPTDEPAEYIRSYSQDTLGRSTSSMLLLAKGLGFASKGFTVAGVAFSVITTVLQMTGAVKNATVQAMEINKEINKNLDYIFDQLKRNNYVIEDINDQIEWRKVEDFNVQLSMLNTYSQKFAWYISAENLEKLGYEPVEVTGDEENAEKAEKYRKLKEISKAVFEAEESRDRELALRFRDYFSTYNTMREYYMNVCALLEQNGYNNPVNTYIKYMSRRSNFDTQTLEQRSAYIDTIKTLLFTSSVYITIYNLRGTTVNDDGTLNLKTVAKTAQNELMKITPQLEDIDSAISAREVKAKDGTVSYKDPYCYTFGVFLEGFDTDNVNVFWANTWREKNTDVIMDSEAGWIQRLTGSDTWHNKAITAWAKGTSVFVYSHHSDYRRVIEESSKAPYYLANDYDFYWGDGFFSAKAPYGLPTDAIAKPLSEDIINANADKFIRKMNGRTLRDELKLAGIKVDETTAEGIPLASTIRYSFSSVMNPDSSVDNPIRAETYMSILKWGDKEVSDPVLVSLRLCIWRAELFRGRWLDDSVTIDGDALCRELETDKKSPFPDDEYGNKNYKGIVRWVIKTTDSDGTSPNPDVYIDYSRTTAPNTESTPEKN